MNADGKSNRPRSPANIWDALMITSVAATIVAITFLALRLAEYEFNLGF
jgi:hypothetical protein